MRIISDFVDYYDCIQRTGIDKDCLYIRKKKSIKKYEWTNDNNLANTKYLHRLFSFHYEHLPKYAWLDFYLVGFCNHVYPVARDRNCIYQTCFYNAQQVIDYCLKKAKKKELDRYKKHGILPQSLCNEKDINRFFDGYKENNTRYKNVFEKHEVPIFTYNFNTKELILNDCLKGFEFYRITSPHAAYQQVYMWMSNIGSPEKPIPQIDDKTMSEAKGFDKYSFRKPKKERR